jgi:hypothetical protein
VLRLIPLRGARIFGFWRGFGDSFDGNALSLKNLSGCFLLQFPRG